MATNDQPYKVGDHITFTDAEGATQTGEIVSTAQPIMLDGSQTGYAVILDGDEGTLVGNAHTDVTAVDQTGCSLPPATVPARHGHAETSAWATPDVEDDEAEGETEAHESEE